MLRLVVLFLLFCNVVAVARAADDPPVPDTVQGIRETDARVGTHIKKLYITGPLPPEKTYDQLSAREKAITKAPYDAMADDDEPPYPLHGRKKLLLAMHQIAETLEVQGDTSMIVQVNSQGDAVSVQVMTSPDAEFTRYLASALMLEKYKPARCGGVPCALDLLWEMNFVLSYD